jgi:hypothetical protein
MSTHNVQNTWRLSVGLYVRNNRYGFTFPCFGAGSSFRSSRSFAASSPHLQQSFSQPLNRSGMFDVDESGEVEVIIQQFQSVPTAEPNKPAKKGIYVQPHWADGGYGVHVLEPGHWTNPEKQPGR